MWLDHCALRLLICTRHPVQSTCQGLGSRHQNLFWRMPNASLCGGSRRELTEASAKTTVPQHFVRRGARGIGANTVVMRTFVSCILITSMAGRMLAAALPVSVQTATCSSLGNTTGVAVRKHSKCFTWPNTV